MNRAPSSCSHSRTARMATSAPSEHAHRSTDRRAQDVAGPADVAHRHGVLQRAGDVAALLERSARPVVGGAEPASSRATPAGPAGRRRTGGGSGTSRPARPAAPGTGWRRAGARGSQPHRSTPVTAATQLGIEGVEHRRLDEEVDELGRQAGQHLADEEVADGTIGAGERLQEVVSAGCRAAGRSPPAGPRPASPR